jgi:hypothetical protein
LKAVNELAVGPFCPDVDGGARALAASLAASDFWGSPHVFILGGGTGRATTTTTRLFKRP